MAMQCAKCGRTFNFLTQNQYDATSGWCKNCLNVHYERIRVRTEKFQIAFRHQFLTNNAQVTPEVVTYFHNYAQQCGLTSEQAFTSVRTDAIHIVQRALTLAKSDNIITPQEEAYIYYIEQAFHLSATDTASVRSELRYLKVVQSIRAGMLPKVNSSLVLPTTEACHWESPANYYKELTRQTKVFSGSLVITNQKVRFVSPVSGFEFPLSKVASVGLQSKTGLHLQLTRTQGNGLYEVNQADILCEIMNVLLKRFHRQDVLQQAGTRSIPQAVKAAVWQRDNGKCAQCGASDYLEYDHIIPFSKGGATSTNNLQLLCRRCNLSKGDRL